MVRLQQFVVSVWPLAAGSEAVRSVSRGASLGLLPQTALKLTRLTPQSSVSA